MNRITGLGRQTTELHAFILSLPNVSEHPKGHSKYLYRYRTNFGAELAVEKRKGAPLLYMSRGLAGDKLAALDPAWVPAGTTGRNSNLNTLETFKNNELARLRVTSLETARLALSACLGA